MHTNLTIDIPKQYNDASKDEVAKVFIELKKLVNNLNFELTQIIDEIATIKSEIATIRENM